MEDTKDNVLKKILKNKKVLIGISVAIIIVLILIIIAIKFSNKKDEFKVKYEGTSNGIEYSSAMQANSEVYVLMKNKTGKTISGLELVISYYDAEGKELARRTSSSDVYLKNEEVAIDKLKSEIYKIENINEYKIEVIPEFYEGEEKKSNFERVEISEIQNLEDEVAVDVKNISEEQIYHMCFYAVFFKDGKPINYYAKDVYNFNKETRNIKFGKPVDRENNKIEYDFCEIYY